MMNDSRKDFYYKAMRTYSEDDFTKEIVVPLFNAMGYKRVEFHGGVNERGRDLIATYQMPPPNKQEYIVYVQSKKLNKNNKLNKVEFDRLIMQLRQAYEVPFISLSGQELKPNQLYIATPNLITQRFLEEVKYNLYSSQQENVEPLDCVKILDLIEEHCIYLLEKLEPFEEKLWSTKSQKLPDGNSELLGALCSQRERVDISNFYSDLSFFVGNVDSRVLVSYRANIIKSKLKNIYQDKWGKLKTDRNRILDLIGFDIFLNKPEFIENKYNIQLSKYNSKTNQNNISSLNSIQQHFKDNTEELESTFYLSIKRLKEVSNKKSNSTRYDLEEIISMFSSQKDKVKQTPLSYEPLNITDYLSNIDSDIKTMIEIFIDKLNTWSGKLKENSIDIKELENSIVDKPFFDVKLNAVKLEKEIENRAKEYRNHVETLNRKERPNLAIIRDILDKVENNLKFFEYIYSEKSSLKSVMELSSVIEGENRVSISAQDVFYTSKNIAVYGGAGVGKTTTLEIFYSSYNDKITGKKPIFCSLNRVVQKLSQLDLPKSIYEGVTSEQLNNIIFSIVLLSYGVDVDSNNIDRLKRYFEDGVLLIFDGLDEIVSEYPIVLDSMNNLRKSYPNVQWIISSRDCVSYLDQIDFLGITLLPFTKSQLKDFIYGWFDGSPKAESLWEEVCQNEMHVNLLTPLISTILCTLVEKGVKAPSNENEIYNERISLLLGRYDDKKKIKRQQQSLDDLLTCARTLALYMHSNGIRSIEPDRARLNLYRVLDSKYSKSLIENCLRELEDPCNVLIRDKVSNTLSFGHFRFQEHLTAMELKLNRSVDLTRIVVKDWWRGAFCLFAQSIDSVESTIEEITKGHQEIPLNAYTTLYAMCEVISPKKGKETRNLLEHLSSPYSEYLELDNYSDRYDEYW